METTRDFIANGDRYAFDFDVCSIARGYAQVDTSQDAWYYGTWANPFEKKIVSYCEGDITVQQCESPQEFVEEIRAIRDWNVENGHKFLGIDPGFNPDLRKEFVALGLLEFLH